MASALQKLLDSIKDGVLVVNLAGQPVYSNPAAKQTYPNQLKEIANHPDLKKAIADAVTGKIQLPTSLRIAVGGDAFTRTTVSGTLIPAPNQVDFALLMHAQLSNDEYTNSLHNFFELMRQELRTPIVQFLESTQKLAALPAAQSCVESGKELVQRLEKLIDLVEVFGDDALLADERIIVKDLVTSVWQELAPLAAQRKIEASMVGFSQDVPPVYGSSNWLKRAIRECLENAVKHSSESLQQDGGTGHIEIRVKTSGQHLMLTVRNLGKGMLPKIADRVFLPFNRAGIPKSAPNQGLSIGLPLAQRIVQLHGGQIRIQQNDDDSTELVMELPTGAPVGKAQRDAAKMDIQQAQKYAEDLSKLIARRRQTDRKSDKSPAPTS